MPGRGNTKALYTCMKCGYTIVYDMWDEPEFIHPRSQQGDNGEVVWCNGRFEEFFSPISFEDEIDALYEEMRGD